MAITPPVMHKLRYLQISLF